MNEKLRALILEILREEGLPEVELSLREIPFKGQLGLALANVFEIARASRPDASKKELKEYAEALAELIAERLRRTGVFERVAAEKGYVNCFFRPDAYARGLIARILAQGVDWAKGPRGGVRVMVEYSQPNTHKAFHIGHVRNVALGAALVRCFRYAGRDTVAANYYGDIGSHVFKALWGIEKLADTIPQPPEDPQARGAWLGQVYSRADALLDESQELRDRVWDILKPLSASLRELWADDELAASLGLDPLTRRIALKEEDLFENRSTAEVIALLESLRDASLQLYRKALSSGRIGPDHPASEHAAHLEELLSEPDFNEIWNREREALEVAIRWNRRDAQLIALWRKTRQWSLDDFDRIYGELGAPFDEDAVFHESEVEEEGLSIVEELAREGIVSVSEGARIVEIDKQLHDRLGEPMRDKYRVLVLVRADGTSLYGAKDLALARRKFEDFGIEESIYVVGSEQKFYFQQLFQILRLVGFPQWEKCFHLAYELVMLPGGKISSRKGQVVLYDDVRRELENRALDVVRRKNPDLSEDVKRRVARDVAKGALLYGLLRVDTNKTIKFDFDEVLDFDGRSAPYIQYAGARAMSIFRKAADEGIPVPDSVEDSDFTAEPTPAEMELLDLLGRFPQVVQKIVESKKPIHLASYAYDLAVAFSDFYHKCPVLTAEPPVRRARLLMVKAVRTTIEAALGLLGIPAPEIM